MRYEIVRFVPIPLCNTFSMHLLKSYYKHQTALEERVHVLITDTNGVVHFINSGADSVRRDLKTLLDEGPLEDFSLELVCSDVSNYGCEEDESVFAHVATCWAFYDNLFCPRRFMVVFFRVLKDFTFERCYKSDISFAPTLVKSYVRNNRFFWLLFGHARNVQCFECPVAEEEKLMLDGVGEIVEGYERIFPAFDRATIYGSLTRSDQLEFEGIVFNLMGFDTGHLVATVSATDENELIDRTVIKYNTPISIASFINLGLVEQELYVVISSTIGPAAVWALKFDQEKQTLNWEVRCQLLESDRHDCVVSAAVTSDAILIGTYGEQLLFYSVKDALCCSEILPINQLNVGAPILVLAPIDADDSLLVLSSKGLQQYDLVEDDTETITDNQSANVAASSNSSSPVSGKNIAETTD